MTDASRPGYSRNADSEYADPPVVEGLRPNGVWEPAPKRKREPTWTPTFLVAIAAIALVVGAVLIAARFA